MRHRIQRAKEAIEQAKYLLAGAGAGFSAAAGLTYGGPRFEANFPDFIRRYGMTDMYSAAFYPFASEEEKWAYWAQHIWVNRFAPGATSLYRQLRDWLADKNHFIITTNADGQFDEAGFDPERLFKVQGDYSELQCATPCHDGLYDNRAMVEQWRAQTVACRIPGELVPQCPVCGGRMIMHLRIDHRFVENADWHRAQARYQAFARQTAQDSTVYLELGVGYNTPGIIRYPFEQMTLRNPRATLIRLNRDDPQGLAETAAQTISFSEDPGYVLQALAE